MSNDRISSPQGLLIEGRVFSSVTRGGLTLLLDEAGAAFTVPGPFGCRLPTAADIAAMIEDGSALPVPAAAPGRERMLRSILRARVAADSARRPEARPQSDPRNAAARSVVN